MSDPADYRQFHSFIRVFKGPAEIEIYWSVELRRKDQRRRS
jgi:hypothetical protein